MTIVRRAPAGALVLALCACSADVTGPAPKLADGSGGVLPAEPAYVCRTRDETVVTVHGDRMAPLAVGLPDHTRAALPTVTLTRTAALDGTAAGSAQIAYGPGPDDPNAMLVHWIDRTSLTFAVHPLLDLVGQAMPGTAPAGLYDLDVENANGKHVTSPHALAVVEPPSLHEVTPGVVCVSEQDRDVTLDASDLVVIDGVEPKFGVGDAELPVASLDGCTDVAHPHVPGRTCTTAKVTLPKGGLPPGFLDVQARNPEPAACRSADPVKLRVVPPPSIAAVEPPIACVVEGARDVVIHGTDFLRIDGQVPAVVMTDATGAATPLEVKGADGCEALETQGDTVERCSSLTVTVPQRPAEDPFRPTLTVTNPDPAGCGAATSTGLMLVPPPTIATVDPPLTCTAQGDRMAVVHGTGFLRIGDDQATFDLDGSPVALTELQECEDLPVEGLTVQRCAAAAVVFPDGVPTVDAGMWAQPALHAHNPDPAGCNVEATGPITFVPPPVVAALDPPLVCVAQGQRTVTLTGSGFVSVDGALPQATAAGIASGPTALADCADVPVAGQAVQTCTTATLVVPDQVMPGLAPIVAVNPDPAGCTSTDALDLRVVPPPTIASADPPIACPAEGPRDVVLHGQDFLGVGDALPAVTMTGADGGAVALEVRALAGDCEDVPTTGLAVRRCDALQVVVPAAVLDAPYRPTLTVTNPDPAGCDASSAEVLTLVPPPSLAAVDPALVCTAQGERPAVVRGAHFLKLGDALPAVSLDGAPAVVDGLADCEALPVAGVDAQICATANVRLPAGVPAVPEGQPFAEPGMRLENPAPAGCSATLESFVALVPPPAASAVDPPVVCLAEGQRTLTVIGTGLIRVGATLPTVTLGDAAVPVTALDDCAPLPRNLGETCDRATVTIADLPAGTPALTFTNPPAADCHSDGALTVRIVPAPSVASVEPNVVAPNAASPVTLHGADFLQVGDALPSVTATDAAGDARALRVLGVDGCEALPAAGPAVQRCAAVRVEVPAEAIAQAYRPQITVRNPDPAGCAAVSDGALLLVPEPAIDAGRPAFLCAGGGAEVVVNGAGFLTVDGRAPAATLDGVPAASVAAEGCTPVEFEGAQVQSCTALRLGVNDVPAGGDVDLVVTQPDPVVSQARGAASVIAVQRPRLDDVAPSLVCTEDGVRRLTIHGDHFLDFGGTLPTVRVGAAELPAAAVGDCQPQSAGDLGWRDCRTLDVDVPQGALAAGTPDVEVVGPAPAVCAGTGAGLLTVPPALTLAGVQPDRACVAAGDRVLRLTGTGFLDLDGTLPSVTVGPATFRADSLADCQPIAAPGHQGRACTTLLVTVPRNAVGFGPQPVGVTNPDPSGCGERADGLFAVIPLPDVSSVVPDEVCAEGERHLTITGHNFIPESQVALGNVPATSVQFVSDTTLTAVFDQELEAGLYDLTVANGDGCTAVAHQAVRVHPMPIVFFVDPPVVYNGIAVQATVYTSGLDATPAQLQLLGPAGQVVDLVPITRDGKPNKILATLPQGLDTGTWGVRVVSRIGCAGSVDGGLQVTDDLRLHLAAVDPGFASPTVATSVTIQSDGGFVSTPRAYLNPVEAGDGVLATALRAVVFIDPSRLTAVVPPDLAPGHYDLIVVNPDATVGVLNDAITVTEGEPPVVTAVEPASLDGNAPQQARVLGHDFDAAGGVTLALTCRDPVTHMERTLPATVDPASLTDTSVAGTFPADQFAAGSVCLVVVTNADGASFRYSAISIKTPAQNLNTWSAQAQMGEARRAPALVAGRPTASSRFLYAIGGDDGAPASAKATVESIPVDVYGDLSAWTPQRHALPAPRTLAGVARVGRFVYVVGGDDGAQATDTVLRAQILDPLAGPSIEEVSLDLVRDAPDGVGPGLWHYRIAAVFGPDDAVDPGGESLPGEVLVAQLPAIAGLRVHLDWNAVPGAVGYRVYRTAHAGDPADQVVLTATIDGGANTTWTDAGAPALSDERPLPPGSLGTWHVVGQLSTPREAAGVAAAPMASGEYALFAIGGRNATGTYLDTYDVARISADGATIVTPFHAGPQRLPAARAELAAYVVTNADTAAVPAGHAWVFAGPGRTANGFARNVDAGDVSATGDLVSLVATDAVSADLAGYGYGAANGFLFTFGGRAGAPSDTGISGELCLDSSTPGCGAQPAEPPDLRNWNNLGVRLTVPRAYPGSTQESAFFFQVGGVDANGPLRSVERTVQ